MHGQQNDIGLSLPGPLVSAWIIKPASFMQPVDVSSHGWVAHSPYTE